MSAHSECFCWRKKFPEIETPGLPRLRLESHLGDFLNNFELAFKDSLNMTLISEDGTWRLTNLGKISDQFNERTSYHTASGLQRKELDRSITVKYKLHLVQQGRQKKVVVTCGNSIEHRTKNCLVKIFLPSHWREPVVKGKKYEDISSLDPNALYKQQSDERNPVVKSCVWFNESEATSICTALKLDYDSKETVVVDHVHCSALVMQLTASFSGVDLMLHNSHECEFTPSPAYVGVQKSDDECKLASFFPHVSTLMSSVYGIQRYGGAGFGDDAWIPGIDDDNDVVNDADEDKAAPNDKTKAGEGNSEKDVIPEKQIADAGANPGGCAKPGGGAILDIGGNPNGDSRTSGRGAKLQMTSFFIHTMRSVHKIYEIQLENNVGFDDPNENEDFSNGYLSSATTIGNDRELSVVESAVAPVVVNNEAPVVVNNEAPVVVNNEDPIHFDWFQFPENGLPPDDDEIGGGGTSYGSESTDNGEDDDNVTLSYVCFECSGKRRPCANGCSYYTGYFQSHGYFECVKCIDCCEPSCTGRHCAHFGHGYVNLGNRVWRFSYAQNKYDFYDVFDFDRQLERMKMKSSVRYKNKKPKKRGKDKQKRCPRQFGEAKYFRDDFDDADDECSATATTKRGGSTSSCRRLQL